MQSTVLDIGHTLISTPEFTIHAQQDLVRFTELFIGTTETHTYIQAWKASFYAFTIICSLTPLLSENKPPYLIVILISTI